MSVPRREYLECEVTVCLSGIYSFATLFYICSTHTEGKIGGDETGGDNARVLVSGLSSLESRLSGGEVETLGKESWRHPSSLSPVSPFYSPTPFQEVLGVKPES